MVQEEFLGNREFQDPKDLREHQARVVGLVRRVLRVHQVLLDNLESLERMEETAHLALQALQAWMEPLDHRVQWVHQVSPLAQLPGSALSGSAWFLSTGQLVRIGTIQHRFA